jgi:hypothetical protein
LLVGGSGAAIIGAFLPWMQASVLGFTASKSGTKGGDGWIAIALAIPLIVLAIRELAAPDDGRIPGVLAIILAGLLGALTVFELIDTLRKVEDINRAAHGFAHAEIGFGLVLLVIGAGVAFAGAIVAMNRQKSQPTWQGWTPGPPPQSWQTSTWQPPGAYPPPVQPPVPPAPPAPPSTGWPPPRP